jgi:hypothetical protein
MNYVVSGFIRSGTSMMMRMLEAGGMEVVVNENARPRDENNPNGFYETFAFLELSPLGLANLDAIEGKVVKVLANELHRWPADRPVKTVFMDRDTWERLHSMNKLWRTHGPLPERDLPPLPTDGPALISGYLARQRNDVLSAPHLNILRVQYADVRSDTRSIAERVRDHFGIDLDIDAMANVYNDNLYRNRARSHHAQPIP